MNDSSKNDIGNLDRFKLLSEATFEGICIHNNGTILDANQQFCDMFGYTLDEIKGMECFNLIAPQSQETVKEYISTGFQGPYESYSQRKDGSTFPTEVRAKEFQQYGTVLRLAVFRDITEQKAMERQITESEKKYRELYDHSPIALSRTGIRDGKLLECNQALVELLGYDSKEDLKAISNVILSYVNPKDRDILTEELEKNKRIEDFQTQVKRKDGRIIWVEITTEIFPEQGYMEGSMQDITASKVLSPAEKKVLRLIVEGMCNKEVARSLRRSVRTVEDHRCHIMKKLEADNLVELIERAKSLKPDV